MTKAGKKKAGGSGKAKAGPRAPAQQLTAEQLWAQAQIALRFDDFDAAKDALRRAVRLEPRSAPLAEGYGALLAELGDPGAREALLHAVSLAPREGHEKYLYLAQLEEDAEKALQYSATGLELLQAKLDGAVNALAAAGGQAGAASTAGEEGEDPAAEVALLKKALVGALCSHAEQVLGVAVAQRDVAAEAAGATERPTGVEPGVASQVEALCARAAALLPRSPEPGQVLASLRSEQGRTEEGLAALRASIALWHKPSTSDDEEEEGEDEEGGAGASGRGAKATAMDEDTEGEGDEEEGPSYEFRYEAAKLLLDLDESTDMAVEVLSALVEEDDSNPDTWQLLALALHSGGQHEEAIEVCAKTAALLGRLGVPRSDGAWAELQELEAAAREALAMGGGACA